MPRLPRAGEEIYSKGFDLQMGGGVPATLINCSRLGVPTQLATFLGQDIFSEFAKNYFAKNNVAYKNLYQGTGIPLNVSSAMITDGERTFASYCENHPVTDALLEEVYRLSTGAKIVVMQIGYLEIYKKLKQEGSILILDIGFKEDLSLENYSEYIDLADYYLPNCQEALKITGTDRPEDAADVLSEHFDKVIVKLDKHGCLTLENGVKTVISEIADFVHRDSTGAGDAFLSGFLYGLYHDHSLNESVLFGNITGGKCITAVGCLAESVSEQELMRLMNRSFDQSD
jgi:sugar/nucleoside kinase (ribokinase family)